MLGSAGCWATFGELLAREFADPALFASSHRLTVDAYALQHPGSADDRRARQSVWIHFASLDAVLGRGGSHAGAAERLRALVGRDYPAPPSAPRWRVTVADVVSADYEHHQTAVARWADHAYRGWLPLLGTTDRAT